ncbi:FAD-binding domain-containing protein [Apiospora sp. TS-2023a]
MRFLINLSLAVSALAAAIPTDNTKPTAQNIELDLVQGTESFSLPDPKFPIQFIQRHSSFANPDYFWAMRPLNIQDVSTIVKFCNQHNFSYMATGGGHGTSIGFANVKNAIDIDLSKFNKISLYKDDNLVTVGAANVLADFADILYKAGKEIPTGNSPCVSAIGATIGAGVGPMQGQHGLMIDSLRSVRMVTPNGDIVTASQTENPDLFWAVRGAGANFGIITEATYELYDATNGGQHVNADFEFPRTSHVGLFQLWRSWDSDDVYPKEMSLSVTIGYDHETSSPTLSASVYYFGPPAAAKPYLQRLVDLGPTKWHNETLGWNGMTQAAGFGQTFAKACVRGRYTNYWTAGIRQTDPATWSWLFASFARWSASRPWVKGSVILQRYNSKVTQQLPEAQQGAYPWRDIGTLVLMKATYDGPVHDAEVAAFYELLRGRIYETSEFLGAPRVYINYANGDEGAGLWYGPNLVRLRRLKEKWDPENRFGKGFSIS